MKIVKIIGIVLLIALVVIQFIPANKNDGERDVATDIAQIYEVPAAVQKNLQVSCYDCHSNSTDYPWYNKIQPVAFYLENHVEDGKKHLNFSEFGNLSLKHQKKKLKEIAHEVEDGEMPLTSYTLIHQDANLSESEKDAMIKWAKELNASL